MAEMKRESDQITQQLGSGWDGRDGNRGNFRRPGGPEIRNSQPSAPPKTFIPPAAVARTSVERGLSPSLVTTSSNREGMSQNRASDRSSASAQQPTMDDRWQRGQAVTNGVQRDTRPSSPARDRVAGGASGDRDSRDVPSKPTSAAAGSKRSREPSPEDGETEHQSSQRSKRARKDDTDNEEDKRSRRRSRRSR
jgi:hypothetical protein